MSKTLRELVSTDRRFQSSVNLMLDIANENKIESYIPTRSSLNVLNQYLSDVKESKHGKATVLIGPYGKGKSHLVLVWLALLAGSKTKNKDNLIKRISSVDASTGELAKDIYSSKKKYLPVLISNTDDNLNQAFLVSLYEALQKAGLSDVMPDTYYSEAVDIIKTWELKYENTYIEFESKISEIKKDAASFVSGLKSYNQRLLAYFKMIYPELTSGSKFEPIMQHDALKVYQSINRELKEHHNYDGIIIVFDEFSKYIEGHDRENFASDMRVLQEMCELASSSKTDEGKIELVLIAHKSVKEYGTKLDANVRKEYEGVEGRLQERLFVISGQNNYELIKNTIHKKTAVNEVFKNDTFKRICKRSFELQVFRGLFEDEKTFEDLIAKGCFPMLPLATYLLLGISEKVAQNERTIFTYLCNDEYGSLTNLIAKHEVGNSYYIGADSIYDYFEIQFKENVSDAFIHNEWLKADYALSKAITDDEKKVIKAIALMHMIGRAEELIVDTKTIGLSVGVADANVDDTLRGLIEKQLIVYRARTNQYAFRHNVGIDLDKEIKNRIAGLRNKYSISSVISEIAEMDYLLPRKHNQTFKMTRFFRYIYLTEDVFVSLPDINRMLIGDNFADGCIICILLQDITRISDCINKIESIHDSRVLTIMPSSVVDVAMLIQKYVVIKELLASNEFLSQHQVMKQELMLQLEDVIYEINNEIDSSIGLDEANCSIYHGGIRLESICSMSTFNSLLSDICDEYYKDTPIINHELVNIRRVSGQYLKARNAVITALLSGDDLEVFTTGTSPEAMVFRSALMYTGLYPTKDKYVMNKGTKAVIGEIHKFLKKSVGEKRSFEKLFKKLLGKGFGMRSGVVPIYIASQLVTLSNMPVIYLLDKEVDVSAEILNNICEKPEDYFLYVEEKDADKDRYLESLETVFIDEDFSRHIQRKHQRLSILVGSIQKWYRGLPQCAMQFESNKNRYSNVQMEHIKAVRNIFRKIDINPREVLFDVLPSMLSAEGDFKKCASNLFEVRKLLDKYLDEEIDNAVKVAKEALDLGKDEGLATGLINWYRGKSDSAKKYITSSKASQLMNYISELNTYNDELVASDLSKILIDLYIEDWKDDSNEEFKSALVEVINSVDQLSNDNASDLGEYSFTFKDSTGEIVERNYDFIEDDSTSYFLKNAIESALDDFGDSLETSQKVAVLVQTIEQLIKQK
ncbi:MAG: hypothetical protein K5769_02715 [Pseudobutyrivibrio sp.]|nr:hypothetical protein [Pseudobutyrivibrio sp.]